MTKPAQLEPQPLDSLLAALAEDRAQAADILLDLRRKLTTMFESRGFADAPELVDRTVDRASQKAARGVELRHRPFPYFYGIARHIALETRRSQHRVWHSEQQHVELHLAEVEAAREAADDPRISCFKRCLNTLPSTSQELLESYFDFADGRRIVRRKALAEKLAISEVALRLRVHRLRGKLANCLDRCLQEGPRDSPEGHRDR